eukprot:COSAG05_NODE_13651_length_422_cov_0.934985_2_plen_51_part_01
MDLVALSGKYATVSWPGGDSLTLSCLLSNAAIFSVSVCVCVCVSFAASHCG